MVNRFSMVVLGMLLGGAAEAADPPARPAPVETTAAASATPLALRVGNIRSYMTPEEFRALSGPVDDSNTVIVKADAPLVPMKSELDVPGGIIAPFWALAHPTKAWRIFLPDLRQRDLSLPENKVPPPEFRWGP
jgi:hypothetical protein